VRLVLKFLGGENLDIRQVVEKNIETIKVLRDKFHQNAELSHKEYKTQEIILEFCNQLGLTTMKLANTGVLATLNTGVDSIAIRADMDALPVKGVSHVCGHDYHMAIACGVALVLKELGFGKCVKFIFQPAEESIGGALPMIKEGVLENPKVNNVIGFHVWPEVRVGTIEAASGPSMASVDDFFVTFTGKGGHAAMPHLCKNPLYPAMDFIQTMNSKSKIENNPLDSHVITFSSVQCGNAPNVISDECLVRGTVRTFNKALRSKLHGDILKISSACSENYECSVDVNYVFQYPPLVNDNSFTMRFIETTKKLIGEQNVLPLEKTFAAEDFSFFAEEVPSVHFRLGIADDVKGLSPLHSVNFDASEDSIFYGIYIITNFVLSLYNDK
jgi:amidohydrolase